jgi:hypothetical protein
MIGVQEFNSQWGLGIFFFSTVSRPALGPTQPPIQWVLGSFSPGLKQLGCEADHSPISSAKVKNVWHYTSTPQYVFMAWCLVKHRDSFNFTFYENISSIKSIHLSYCPNKTSVFWSPPNTTIHSPWTVAEWPAIAGGVVCVLMNVHLLDTMP